MIERRNRKVGGSGETAGKRRERREREREREERERCQIRNHIHPVVRRNLSQNA